MTVTISGAVISGIAAILFWVAIGVTAVACIIATAYLVSPRFAAFVRSVKW
jgi:hypothetical protein